MDNHYSSLREELIERGYPEKSISNQKTIKVRDIKCGKVEIFYKGFVIQAFAIMTEEQRNKHHVYPFYNDYEWNNTGGQSLKVSLKPPCSLAVLGDDGKWSFYNASDSDELRHDQSIQYKNVKKSFLDRFNKVPLIKFRNKVKWIAWVSSGVLSIYLVCHLILESSGDIALKLPLDMGVLTAFVIIIALALIPVLIPYINSLKIPGLDAIVQFTDDDVN